MKTRAFTLIELLVVIAIIGVLSSTVLASLSNARLKARDSAIKASTLQLRTIMQQEFSDTGSFVGIKAGGSWKAAGYDCTNNVFSGSYATKAMEVCNSLMSSYPAGTPCDNSCVYFQTTSPNASDTFSIMAYLPGASAATGVAQYLCYGSSGRTSVGTYGTPPWSGAGCFVNP